MELLLQFASANIPKIEYITSSPQRFAQKYGPQMIPAERLGRKGNPRYPNYDARGFRNRDALARTPVVAMGDSHTYGTSVGMDEAWPSVLARDLAQPVYNMGLGSYGAAHNNENLSIALALKPKVVIFALYFGNDFIDDFSFASRNGLLSTLAPADALQAIRTRKPDTRLSEEAEFLFGNPSEDKTDDDPSGTFPKFAESLTDKSRFYGFLRTLKNYYFPRPADDPLNPEHLQATNPSLDPDRREHISSFDDGAWKTEFTALYRSLVMDNTDPRVRAGVAISKHMIARMQERIRDAGAKFVVLLAPTKEFVFWPRVRQPEQHPHLAKLVKNEEQLHREMAAYLERRGIEFIDPAPALRSTTEQPYFPNMDGHPNPHGHVIIATELRKSLTLKNTLPEISSAGPGNGSKAGENSNQPGEGSAR